MHADVDERLHLVAAEADAAYYDHHGYEGTDVGLMVT